MTKKCSNCIKPAITFIRYNGTHLCKDHFVDYFERRVKKDIRKQGKIVNLFYGKPSKAMEYANSYNMNKVIFVGSKELKKKLFKVKDMKTGKEKKLK